MYEHRFAMSPAPKSAKRPAKATPRKRYFVFGPELQLGLYKKSKSPQRKSKSASRGSGNTAAKSTLTFWYITFARALHRGAMSLLYWLSTCCSGGSKGRTERASVHFFAGTCARTFLVRGCCGESTMLLLRGLWGLVWRGGLLWRGVLASGCVLFLLLHRILLRVLRRR